MSFCKIRMMVATVVVGVQCHVLMVYAIHPCSHMALQVSSLQNALSGRTVGYRKRSKKDFFHESMFVLRSALGRSSLLTYAIGRGIQPATRWKDLGRYASRISSALIRLALSRPSWARISRTMQALSSGCGRQGAQSRPLEENDEEHVLIMILNLKSAPLRSKLRLRPFL